MHALLFVHEKDTSTTTAVNTQIKKNKTLPLTNPVCFSLFPPSCPLSPSHPFNFSIHYSLPVSKLW